MVVSKELKSINENIETKIIIADFSESYKNASEFYNNICK